MKRSVVEQAIGGWGDSAAGISLLMELIDKAVAHGYEPEEPEVAPVLVAVGTFLMTPIEDADKPGGRRRYASHKETVLAAEAYNRRGVVADMVTEVARELRVISSFFERPGGIVGLAQLDRLAKRLDQAIHGADTQDGEGRS